MKEIEEIGGAEVGFMRMTWPFATLTVNKNKLQLNCSISGTFLFRPTDIVSIEPSNRLLKTGIRINHKVSNYNSNIVFSGGSKDLIEEIKQTGFLDNLSLIPYDVEAEISEVQTNGAFPLKVSSAIIIVVIWNILFLGDWLGLFGKQGNSPLGIGSMLAMIFMLLVGALLLMAPPVRKLIMKEGRSIKSIRFFLYFTIFILFIMLVVVFGVQQVANTTN